MIAVASTVIDVPLEDVWHRLEDFASWHTWIPGMDSTVMDAGLVQGPVGSVRILHRADGSTIREKLVLKDDRRHTMAYSFDGPHPFPVRRYVGTVRLEPVTTTNATFVHWSGDFDADAADESRVAETFRSIYTMFFDALAESKDSHD